MGMLEHEDYGPQRRAAEKAIGQTRDFLVDQATDPLNYLGPAGKGLGVGAKVARGLFATTLAGKADDANAMFFGGKYLPTKVIEQLEAALKQGASKQEIFQKTGYFKNPQGEWRRYVTDSKAAPTGNLQYMGSLGPAKNYMVHPDLYNLDPRLGENLVRTTTTKDLGGAYGEFDPNTRMLGVASDRPPKDVFSTLLHEVQHIIQDVGKVSEGTNPYGFTTDWHTPKVEQAIESYNKLFGVYKQKWGKSFDEVREALATGKSTGLPIQSVHDLMAIKKVESEIYEFKREARMAARFNKYSNNPGEVEARVTQAAMDRNFQTEPNGLKELYDLYGKEITAPTYYDNFQFTFD